MFKPGNQLYKNRKTDKGGSTRLRPLKLEIDALKRDKENVPKYLQKISDIALSASDDKLALQAAMYLIDRHEGKAKNTTDLTVTPRPYSTDDYELMAQVKIAQEKLLLDAGTSPYIVVDNGIGEMDTEDTNDRESADDPLQSCSIRYTVPSTT